MDRRRWTAERRHTSQVPWEARLAALKSYQAEHGDCNVPRDWVGLDEGLPSLSLPILVYLENPYRKTNDGDE